MNHLNYFFPYQSKQDNHEDQLSRAFMVLLKHSSVVAFVFYDMCKEKFDQINLEEEQTLPYFSKLVSQNWDSDTQKSNPAISTMQLLSVLITDMPVFYSKKIASSTRSARYDGIITIGEELTIIIENKPNSGNVWFDQLSPSDTNLSQVTEILKTHVLLQWKDIISMLTSLLEKGVFQTQLIDDFLSYIDISYPMLNPYDKLHLCKNNSALLERRIKNILENIAIDKSQVEYHKGWAYKIELGLPQIRMIGLVLVIMEGNWRLELSIIAGNTVNQSRALYASLKDWGNFDLDGMYPKTDFHFSHVTSNIIWFQSPDVRKYVNYWKDHIEEIKQYNIRDIDTYLYKLNEQSIVKYTKIEQERFDDVSYNFQTVNLCAGFGFIWNIESEDAIKYDEAGTLEQMIANKIHLGLAAMGTSTSYIIKAK